MRPVLSDIDPGRLDAPEAPTLTVPCPACRARPGHPCHTPKGRQVGRHPARLEAWLEQRRYRKFLVRVATAMSDLGVVEGEVYLAETVRTRHGQRCRLIARVPDGHISSALCRFADVQWLGFARDVSRSAA